MPWNVSCHGKSYDIHTQYVIKTNHMHGTRYLLDKASVNNQPWIWDKIICFANSIIWTFFSLYVTNCIYILTAYHWHITMIFLWTGSNAFLHMCEHTWQQTSKWRYPLFIFTLISVHTCWLKLVLQCIYIFNNRNSEIKCENIHRLSSKKFKPSEYSSYLQWT
jgi:hypothetical protein